MIDIGYRFLNRGMTYYFPDILEQLYAPWPRRVESTCNRYQNIEKIISHIVLKKL